VFLPLKDGKLTETMNQFFRSLLEKKIVDALIVPQAILGGKSCAQTLVRDPSKITHATPFLPVLMNSGAKLVSSLTAWDPGQKLGVVLRSCEIRALIELAKFKQAHLDPLFIIGVDCLGTVESRVFEEMLGDDHDFKIEAYLSDLVSGNGKELRKACQVCCYPSPENVDMNLGFIGIDSNKGIYINTNEEIANTLGIESESDAAEREKVLASIVASKKKKYDEFLTEIRKRFKSIPELLNEFARCKRCYNCRVECPICFCKECVFITNIIDHKPAQYLRWAERKGAMKLPADTLLFHMTRLNHMVASCVECGMCSSACPNQLPVFDLFMYVGKDVQALFDYVPGMHVDDDPPLNTFKEKELEPQ